MSDERPLYTVTVHREDGLWVAAVDGVPAGATDVDHFVNLDDSVRDLIATLTDVDPEDFDVAWVLRQGENDLTEALADLQQWEMWSDIALDQRDHARKKMVDAMRVAGFSYRETAEVMGISHQRVSQLSGDSKSAVGGAGPP